MFAMAAAFAESGHEREESGENFRAVIFCIWRRVLPLSFP
jgi:hypothetical protein